MKLYLYLAISLLAHLILLAFLSETYFRQKEIEPVFNVDIVAPFEPVRNLPETIIPPRVIKKITKKSLSPVRDLKPEVMFGEGDLKKVSEDSSASEASDKAETGSKSRATDTDASSEKAKEGPYLARESSQFNREEIKKRGEGLSSEQNVISFDTSDLKFRGYMRFLKEKIEGIWQYPEKAKKLGRSGDLNMRFVIKRDGTLGKIEIIRPSGYPELDSAAMKAVKDAAPFWPLPKDWEGDDYTIDGHFIYDMRGPYVW